MRFVHTADTHLGFDILKGCPHGAPQRARWAASIHSNFRKVLQHVRQSGADLLIHSGDLFHQNHFPENTFHELVRPLVRLAQEGTAVVVVPGNHEKGEFPFDLFHGAPGIFVLDRPKSLVLHLEGFAVGICGFPYLKGDSRALFPKALDEAEHKGSCADLHFLVTHQAFHGATVGPQGYMFRASRLDTVPLESIPPWFDYVAAGHIHRHQILRHPENPDLAIAYPGSTQRMSLAERHEPKGFLEGEVSNNRVEFTFVPLPACPMEVIQVEAGGMDLKACEEAIRSHFWRIEQGAIVRFNLTGGSSPGDYPAVDFKGLRAELPQVLQCQFALRTGRRWVQR